MPALIFLLFLLAVGWGKVIYHWYVTEVKGYDRKEQ